MTKIEELISKKILCKRSEKIGLNPHIKKYIESDTIEFIIDNYIGESLSEKIWRYVNTDNSIKRCKCNNILSFKNISEGFRKYCSRNCSRPVMIGVDNPMYNKRHTLETRIKMSQNHADFKGDNNPFKRSLKDPKKLQEHKDRCKKHWESRDELWMKNFKEKQSLLKSNSIIQRGRTYISSNHISSKITSASNFLRSSWEIALAKKLDACSKVHQYEIESISIPYIKSDGCTHHAISDFLITLENRNKIMIEVKPQLICLLKQDILNSQINYSIKENIQYALIDLEIINSKFENIISNAIDGNLIVTHIPEIIDINWSYSRL